MPGVNGLIPETYRAGVTNRTPWAPPVTSYTVAFRRARSSLGRAPVWQTGGSRFDPGRVHVESSLGLVILLAWGVLWLGTIADIVRWPGTTWELSGQSRALWFVLVFFFQFFGLIAYWGIARPRLVTAR